MHGHKDKEDNQKQKGSPRDLLRLISYVKPYWLRLAIAFSSLLVATGLALLYPQLVRLIIDVAFNENNGDKLNTLAVWLMGLFAVQAGFSFLRAYLRKRFLMPRCLRRGWMNHLGEGSMPDAKMT